MRADVRADAQSLRPIALRAERGHGGHLRRGIPRVHRHARFDTMAQVEKQGDQFITAEGPLHDRLQELAPIVAGSSARDRGSEEITLFYSLGLAGTEVTLAALVAELMIS